MTGCIAVMVGSTWYGANDDATPRDDASWCHATPRLGHAPSRHGYAPAYALTRDAPQARTDAASPGLQAPTK